jgi:hypothetical protein
MLVIVCCAGGCLVPYAIPPIKAEGGATTTTGHAMAWHVGGGASLASGTINENQGIDVDVGGFADFGSDATTAGGVYGGSSWFFDRHENVRTSIGFRGEAKWGGDGQVFAAKLRIDHEMYGRIHKNYSGDDRCGAIAGVAHGTGAIGVYAEAGPAWLPMDEHAFVATVGITARIPSTMGVWFGIPGC